jgi:HAD superfamily hydrolase (TIGR01458 family)
MKPTSPRAILIDLAGVLHVGDNAIPGAVEAMRRLRASGLPLRFLTNTTRSPRAAIVDLLARAGLDIAPDEIQTAVHAARQFVAARWRAPFYLVHPDIADEVGPSSAAPDVVVLGDAGPYFSFERMNAAFRLLMRGLPLVAMAKNRYFKEADGLTLDMGAYVAALEYATGVQATVVGKPAAPFFLGALAELGVAPHEAVLIGDDLHDDIGGAQAAGIAGILVRTGKFRAGDDAHTEIRPALVADDFAAAVDVILR